MRVRDLPQPPVVKGVATPTSAQIGMPVVVTFDGTSTGSDYGPAYPNTAAPTAVIANSQAAMTVKYVPTPGAADDV